VEEWYVSTVARKDYVLEVFDRQCAIAEKNILGGYDLTEYAGNDAILVCATETKTDADIDACIAAYKEELA
jgi:glycine cleavage system pyridoxal-binding protein P